MPYKSQVHNLMWLVVHSRFAIGTSITGRYLVSSKLSSQNLPLKEKKKKKQQEEQEQQEQQQHKIYTMKFPLLQQNYIT